MPSSSSTPQTPKPVPSPSNSLDPSSGQQQSTRRTPSQRSATSNSKKRLSTYSIRSTTSAKPSRPPSAIVPAFKSSLPYSQVRDFAYPPIHLFHYGTTQTSSRSQSGRSSPSNEDQFPPQSFEGSGPKLRYVEENDREDDFETLPQMAYGDQRPRHGPPYLEDDDLVSPRIRTTNRRGHDGGSYDSRHDPDLMHDEYTNLGEYASSPPPGDESPIQDDYRYSRQYSFSIVSPDEEMHGKAVALFDFERENENELPLFEGQVIWVSYRHSQGWLVAEDPKTRESGLVPEEFVRLVRDIEGGLDSLQGEHSIDMDGVASDRTMTNEKDQTRQTQASPNLHEMESLRSPTGESGDRPAMISTFSTSSKDLDKYPLPSHGQEKPNLGRKTGAGG